ncbi:hypothetical protein CJ030_MR3G005619 [Morella rubra]|uniref:Uncharacterized protein n=1 Tax=Morella rubra TaxID=262757 RepID=A0A6A1W4I0_9ROSI|nr:hypothetical protein CJ030_MR3G005619 [Morella rubra]
MPINKQTVLFKGGMQRLLNPHSNKQTELFKSDKCREYLTHKQANGAFQVSQMQRILNPQTSKRSFSRGAG